MLRLAARLADEASVSLGEAITGIGDRNVGLLVRQSSTPPDDASSSDSARGARPGQAALRPSSPVGSARSAQGVRVLLFVIISSHIQRRASGEAFHPRVLLCRMSACGWPGVRPAFTSAGALDSEKRQMCSQAGISGGGRREAPSYEVQPQRRCGSAPDYGRDDGPARTIPLRNRATRRSEAPPR